MSFATLQEAWGVAQFGQPEPPRLFRPPQRQPYVHKPHERHEFHERHERREHQKYREHREPCDNVFTGLQAPERPETVARRYIATVYEEQGIQGVLGLLGSAAIRDLKSLFGPGLGLAGLEIDKDLLVVLVLAGLLLFVVLK